MATLIFTRQKMNTQILKLLFVVFPLLINTYITNAQVTIGSDVEPNPGALLDIKEKATTGGEANSSKGLLLPRVRLTTVDSLTDLGITDTTYPKPEYNGMVVYNTTNGYSYCKDIHNGIYVWIENKWVPMFSYADPGKGDVGIYTDLRDPANPEEYKYRRFGNAGIWMTENMRARITPNGIALNSNMNAENGGWLRSIPSYVVPQTVGSLPSLPETDPAKVSTWRKEMGLLYNWAAATVTTSGNIGAGGADGRGQDVNEEGKGEGTRKQGICPPGWHLPSDKEWTLLENEIIRNTSLYTYDQANISQTDTIEVIPPTPILNLKSYTRGTHGTAMTDYCLSPKNNQQAGKSKSAAHGGFAAVPAGYYTTYGGCANTSYIYYSSSSQSRKGSMWYRALNRSVTAGSTFGADDVHFFFAVRCKKD